jgi:general secretion pathway protein G
MRTRISHRNAFTLIELLLVMVILVVLAAVVVPKFTSRSQQAKNTAAIQQISNFKTAFDAFEVDNGRYPSTEEGIAALGANIGNWQNWHGPYMENPPLNDPWDHPYIYRFPGTHGTSFDLLSIGADGQEGTGDDIVSWAQNK